MSRWMQALRPRPPRPQEGCPTTKRRSLKSQSKGGWKRASQASLTLTRSECLFMRGACAESDNEEPENAQVKGASLGLAGHAGRQAAATMSIRIKAR